jgi:hypothetical protein
MARIYQTTSLGEAQVRVALVADRAQADLLVYRVGSWGLAHGDALWFITRDKQDANCWIHMTSLGMAELKLCFVDTYGEAGWVTPRLSASPVVNSLHAGKGIAPCLGLLRRHQPRRVHAWRDEGGLASRPRQPRFP